MSRFCLAFASLLLLACTTAGVDGSGRATSPLEPNRRDSAGIVLLEHPGNALERAPLITMDSAPLAVFAEAEDDPSRDLGRLWSLQFTSIGELVALDRQQRSLVLFDLARPNRRVLAGAGSGPGEIGNISGLAVVVGDTLLLTDRGNGRVAVAHADSGVIRTESFATLANGGGRILGRTNNGLMLMGGTGGGLDPRKGDGEVRMTARASTWRPGSDSAIQRIEIPGQRMRQVVRGSGQNYTVAGYDFPLSAVPRILVSGDQFVVAVADQWILERRDTSGMVRSMIRVAKQTVLVDEAIWRRYIDADIATMLSYSPTLSRDSLRQELEATEHADTLPAFGDVVVTANGLFWVIDYRVPGDSGWAATAVAADGRILGRIVELRGDQPIAFGDDRLAFRTEDDDGIATLTIRQIRFE